MSIRRPQGECGPAGATMRNAACVSKPLIHVNEPDCLLSHDAFALPSGRIMVDLSPSNASGHIGQAVSPGITHGPRLALVGPIMTGAHDILAAW